MVPLLAAMRHRCEIHAVGSHFHVVVIGGGIVGVATAMTLTLRGRHSVVVLEAEDHLASHQSGRNSGVIHSGLYYRPGSQKALHCVAGRKALYRFCAEEGIPHRQCGKLVVATSSADLPTLEELFRRGRANGLQGLRRVTAPELRELEPAASGTAGLWVPQTGVVDFAVVTRGFARKLQSAGGEIRTGTRVLTGELSGRRIQLRTTRGELHADLVVNCAGLQADRIARSCGSAPTVAIVPFRGLYYELAPEQQHLVRNVIYPVPNPALPFLGVHLTRTIRDTVEAGPNAILALKREGYGLMDFSARDIVDTLRFPGFRRMTARWWRVGLQELGRSTSRRRFARQLQKLVPDIQPNDLRRSGTGIRAQAVDRKGNMLDDFHILEGQQSIHVLNAPSPAATAALSLASTIAEMVLRRLPTHPS